MALREEAGPLVWPVVQELGMGQGLCALQAPHRQYKCAQKAPPPPLPASQANLAHARESSPPAGSVPAITQVRAVAWNHGHLSFTRLGLRREEG